MEGTSQSQEKGLDAGIIFGHDHHFAFVYKKTEKLVTAVYMVTDFIKDNEPLKWKIRESALSLMELNLEWNTISLAERRSLIKECQTLALEIVSLSSIAHHAGMISEMNFRVLSREFDSLVRAMDENDIKAPGKDNVILDPAFFSIGGAESSKTPPAPASVPAPAPTSVRIEAIHKGHNEIVSRTPEKEDRRSIIIRLLSGKSGLSVKDFTDSIKGVSEKTIQRELLAMVAAGVLKKEGERRWSTYSIAAK